MADRHDLVLAARAEDAEAFMGLVRLETPGMYRLCLTILRQPNDAEDALQEAFARAWRELPKLRETERWAAWFRRIVVTSAIDTGRRKGSHRIVSLNLHPDPAAPDGADEVAARDAFDRAIGHLGAQDRALLALRFGDDLELPDVAAALGIPLGTAKSRLHRLLARLRKELENTDGHRGAASGEAADERRPATTGPRL